MNSVREKPDVRDRFTMSASSYASRDRRKLPGKEPRDLIAFLVRSSAVRAILGRLFCSVARSHTGTAQIRAS